MTSKLISQPWIANARKSTLRDKKDLKQLFNEYLQACEYSSRLRPETIRGYKDIFRNFTNLMPGIDDPELITSDSMTEFFQKLETRKRIVGRGIEKSGVKKSTIKTYWSKLNSFFEWLHIKEIIVKNPLEHMTPPQPEYNDKRALRKAEIEKIITAIQMNSKNALILNRDMMIINLLIFCGLRKGEISSLQVRDIDMSKRVLTVRGETSKSKKTRELPINQSTMIHIEEYLKERKIRGYKTEYLIVSNGSDSKLTVHGFKHWVKRLEEHSGVKFHLHRFRHTFACNLVRQNSNIANIQRLMGHTDLRMTQRYLRSLGVEDLREDVNRMSLDNLI